MLKLILDMKYVTSLIKDVYEKKSLDFISHLDISSVSESSVSDTLSSEIQESNSDSKNVGEYDYQRM